MRRSPGLEHGWSWRDTLFTVGPLVMIGFCLLLRLDPADREAATVGLACWAAIPIVYFAVARRLPDATAAARLWLVPVVLLAASPIVLLPELSFGQAILFPHLWTVLDEVRHSILASLAVVLAILLGQLALHGPEPLPALAGYGALSFILNLGIGLLTSRMWAIVEERGRLLEELEAAQERVRVLSAERGAAAERERLSRELHDTLAQTLAGLSMLAERVERRLSRTERAGAPERPGEARHTEQDAAQLARIAELSRTALAETRAILADAAPVEEDPDLAAALVRLAARYRRETGLEVEVHAAEPPGLDRERRTVLLRCAQEGLANVRKHAGACRAVLRLSTAGEPGRAAQLELWDDGRGFEPAAEHDGLGLPGLRRRLRLAGGELELRSAPGAGTRLTVRLPLAAEAPAPVRPDDEEEGGR